VGRSYRPAGHPGRTRPQGQDDDRPYEAGYDGDDLEDEYDDDYLDDRFLESDDAADYRRPRRRAFFVKAVAITVIFAMLLAFPLGYLLETEMRDGRVTAALAVTEVTIVLAAVLLVRATRRRL
jgi:hypothetical protein